MPMLQCPKCSKTLRTNDSLAGKLCRCPSCAHVFRAPEEASETVPRASTKSRGPAAEESVAEKRPPRADRKKEDDEVVEVEWKEDGDEQPEKRRPRRKRRRRRREGESWLVSEFRYYTGAMGVFAWGLVALAGLWFLTLLVTCLVPPVGLGLLFAGLALVVVGQLWIMFVAFKDEPIYGILCLATNFFTLVYVFMNLEETWRPAVLIVLGVLMAGSGLGLAAVAEGFHTRAAAG